MSLKHVSFARIDLVLLQQLIRHLRCSGIVQHVNNMPSVRLSAYNHEDVLFEILTHPQVTYSIWPLGARRLETGSLVLW